MGLARSSNLNSKNKEIATKKNPTVEYDNAIPWWKKSFFKGKHSKPAKVIPEPNILANNAYSNSDTEIYDAAMQCLCFRCEKCLKVLNANLIIKDLKSNPATTEEIEFVTMYTYQLLK
eukprot:NODE_55_length_29507_cov_0.809712.p26 type:complete len:118 gc:universal NODE_55_length_29507_cov_0.809712:9643-9996(+)